MRKTIMSRRRGNRDGARLSPAVAAKLQLQLMFFSSAWLLWGRAAAGDSRASPNYRQSATNSGDKSIEREISKKNRTECRQKFRFRASGFGFLSDFGFRISAFFVCAFSL